MFTDLEFPFTRQYPMPLGAYVYPSPDGGVGVRVQGSGSITLTFEKMEDPNKAGVRVEDISINLPSLRIPFDIDRDGLKECIELNSFEFGSELFDLEACRGELNLETGDISLNFQLAIPANILQPFSIKAGLEKPLRFSITEHGRFNPITGEGATFSDPFTVEDGPFAGLTIMGDQFDGEIDCSNSLALGAWLLTPSSPVPSGITAYTAKKSVYKHPNTPVLLLWNSSSAGTWQVDVQPDLGQVQPNGQQKIPDLSSLNTRLHRSIDRNIKFTADIIGGDCGTAHDEASINVLQKGDTVIQSATYKDHMHAWYAHLPAEQYDQNIKVYEVIIDTGKPNSIQHPDWRLDHKFPADSPVGFPIPAVNSWTNAAGYFSLPGDYFFKPMPSGTSLPGGEHQRTLYFRLRVRP